MLITDLKAREVLDSRGNPTVEVDIIAKDGSLGRAIVPSGASTGKKEALEIRDRHSSRYFGKGVYSVIQNIRGEVRDSLLGMSVGEQSSIDQLLCQLDGTYNKSRLGANALLAVSMAYTQLSAKVFNMPLFQYLGGVYACNLPVPMANVLNGGVHADNNLDFQEFMLIPTSSQTFSEAIESLVKVFHTLKEVLRSKNYSTSVGDEGGFAPNLSSNQEAIELLLLAIEKSGYRPGEDFSIALDVASSEFYDSDKGKYILHKSTKEELTSSDMVALYQDLIQKYPIISIEDGMAEGDWEGWKLLTDKMKSFNIQIVGDDLFVTNCDILQQGIESNVANSILVKMNQIGTVSETIKTVRMAQGHHYKTIASHRSGESEDVFLADLAVGINMGQIKTGSLSRSDRVAKYNQLLRIEEILGSSASYLGRNVFR